MSFIERVEAVVPAPNERKPALSLSKIGWGDKCERRLAYAHHGIEGEEVISPARLRKMRLGWFIEDAVIEWMNIAGIWMTGRQQTVHWNGIAGHIDGMVSDGNGAAVVDVKSMSDRSLRDMRRDGIEGSIFTQVHEGQVSAYAHGKNVDRGYIIGIGRDSMEIAVVMVPRNDALLDRLAGVVDRVRLTTVPEDSPRGPGLERDSLACRYCDYQTRCWDGAKGEDDNG